MIEFVEFGKVPDSQLEKELSYWIKVQKDAIDLHNKKLSKLSKRHEASIKNTHLRCERIINAAEDIACEVYKGFHVISTFLNLK